MFGNGNPFPLAHCRREMAVGVQRDQDSQQPHNTAEPLASKNTRGNARWPPSSNSPLLKQLFHLISQLFQFGDLRGGNPPGGKLPP